MKYPYPVTLSRLFDKVIPSLWDIRRKMTTLKSYFFWQQGDEITLKLRLDDGHNMPHLCWFTQFNNFIQSHEALSMTPILSKYTEASKLNNHATLPYAWGFGNRHSQRWSSMLSSMYFWGPVHFIQKGNKNQEELEKCITWNVLSHSASCGGGLFLDGMRALRNWAALLVLIVPNCNVWGTNRLLSLEKKLNHSWFTFLNTQPSNLLRARQDGRMVKGTGLNGRL